MNFFAWIWFFLPKKKLLSASEYERLNKRYNQPETFVASDGKIYFRNRHGIFKVRGATELSVEQKLQLNISPEENIFDFTGIQL